MLVSPTTVTRNANISYTTPATYVPKPSFSFEIPYPYLPRLQLRLLALFHSLTQGPLLHHDRHDLVQSIGSGHGRVLSIRVVCRSNLDDVSSNEVDAVEAAQDGPELARGPTAGLGGARRRGDWNPSALVITRSTTCDRVEVRLTSRVQSIDVNAQIHGVLGPDPLPYTMSVNFNGRGRERLERTNLLDDPINANGVDLTGLNDLEATVAIIVVVRRPTQRCPDAGMDV